MFTFRTKSFSYNLLVLLGTNHYRLILAVCVILCWFNHYTAASKKWGLLFYLCLSVLQTVHPSVCHMNIFVAFFSWTTLQGFLKGLLKSAISFDKFSDSLLNKLFTEHFSHDSQVENVRHIFRRNYNTMISEIWFQCLFK